MKICLQFEPNRVYIIGTKSEPTYVQLFQSSKQMITPSGLLETDKVLHLNKKLSSKNLQQEEDNMDEIVNMEKIWVRISISRSISTSED